MRTSLSNIALLIGCVPIVVINLIYLIAASEGSVPWCIPYWDSCTSISATGREGLAFFFFKSTMLPIGFLYAWYWNRIQQSLKQYGYQRTTIRTLGYCSVLAYSIYVIALGAVGDSFQLTRRIGIIFYFTFTYLCQLLTAQQMIKLQVRAPGVTMQLALCALMLAIGILTLLLDAFLENYDDYEDAFEWNIALLLHINYIVSWWVWKNKPVTTNQPAIAASMNS